MPELFSPRSSVVRAFLAMLEARTPQESFTFAEIRAMMPEGQRWDGRYILDMMKLLTDSGDVLPFGSGSSRSWTLISPRPE